MVSKCLDSGRPKRAQSLSPVFQRGTEPALSHKTLSLCGLPFFLPLVPVSAGAAGHTCPDAGASVDCGELWEPGRCRSRRLSCSSPC